ncbi:RagB/SusD family nutrient uptake outer membrane protein [Desertivirga xinjiangensis]|uniref:RagB/SusD family nutrient uptake outer membrane protein n=1 Tax=Desertivirga xinjiangensis TaxID=539206 RepID=UPI00210C064C|nr:RagB/SusD family nutrient uptake outer membrane protein [Pedobacter xinjiangensis]
MKRHIYIIICAVLLSMTSCDKDFLTVAPRDQISGESFFKTAKDAEQAVVGVYNTLIQDADFTMIQKVLAQNTWSDDAVNVWLGSNYNNIADGSFNSSEGLFNSNWTSLYRNIRRANVFLTNVVGIQMDERLKERYIAEVKFFRAYYYHQLLMLFGGVPIIDKPLNLEELKTPRNKREEVVEFILSDLNAAIPALSADATQPGRVTSGAALSLKSRVLLYEYRFPEAAAAAELVMSSNKYHLYRAEGAQSYIRLFAQANENNQEVIFDVQFTNQSGYGSPEQLWLNVNSIGGWGALNPTKSLRDAFEDIEGNPITASTVYDPTDPYANRDPRLEMSILHTGSTIVDRNGNVRTINTTSGTDASSRTGLFPRKGADPESFISEVTSGKNYILIRYAEVLLNYAEAKNESLNSPDQTVYDAVNDVRDRAGMPDLPENLTKSQMRVRIRNERRVELNLEGHRFFDIKRWGIAETVMNGPVYGVNSTSPVVTRVFDPAKHYLFPIFNTQIDLTGKDILLQNPGYGSPTFQDSKYPKPELFQ